MFFVQCDTIFDTIYTYYNTRKLYKLAIVYNSAVV